MTPRLLLVPFSTELEWEKNLPRLTEWADVAAYDPPGVGDEPLPAGVDFQAGQDPEGARAALEVWRDAVAARGLEEIDRRGWDECFLVADNFGNASALRLAELRPEAVQGIALGHAVLDRTLEGERPAMVGEIWDAMISLMRTDQKSFIGYGIAQMTQGGVTEDQIDRWWERFPDPALVTGLMEVLTQTEEPIGERLRATGLPLLLAQHDGCLVTTDEGFEDMVAAFPEARTVRCAEACAASPALAAALREFCGA